LDRLAFEQATGWAIHGVLAVWSIGFLVYAHFKGRSRDWLTQALSWIPVLLLGTVAKGRFSIIESTILVALSLVGSVVHAAIQRRLRQTTPEPEAELARLWILFLGTICLVSPFITSRANGAGDSHWYALMLADFIQQFRVGVFPLFVGQSEFAFSGTIFPGRFAPYYQYFGVAIDTLTLRQLDVFAVQHLTVVLSALGGVFACYLTLRRILARNRWIAAALALLYVSSPALLAAIYSMDMYMTFMTVPWLPLMVYGIVRSFRVHDRRSAIWLAAPTAVLWYAHAPVAMWSTFFLIISQLFRLVFSWRSLRQELMLGFSSAAIFGALAVFPFVSAYYAEPNTGAANARDMVRLMTSVFQESWQPVSATADRLSDQRLGYGLVFVLIAMVVIVFTRHAGKPLWVLAGIALSALALISPLAELSVWIWANLPSVILNITDHAPPQRLYPIATVFSVFGGAFVWLEIHRLRETVRRLLTIGLILGLLWSGMEASKFIHRGRATTASTQASKSKLHKENIILSRYSYDMFPKQPDYFQNGVIDPLVNNRLLSKTSLARLHRHAPRDGSVQSFMLRGEVKPGTNELALFPPIRLEPGRRYAMHFHFFDNDYTGVLSMTGSRRLFREYVLPINGNPGSFGTGRGQRKFITLWTGGNEAEVVHMRYLSFSTQSTPENLKRFAYVTLREIVPETLPISVHSLIPYRATIRTTQSAWLETIRMYSPGYAAKVNGQTVQPTKSPQGLVMIPVPEGTSEVELSFVGPPLLRAAFWTALAAWATLPLILSPRFRMFRIRVPTRTSTPVLAKKPA
ncbi:MAG TPA: hypothetical protein VKC60_16295, partial [Opitutaceae bacterium]|nr:hypothetical protein [Opitutaceae bacterium]